jgi:hypothetical protein
MSSPNRQLQRNSTVECSRTEQCRTDQVGGEQPVFGCGVSAFDEWSDVEDVDLVRFFASLLERDY